MAIPGGIRWILFCSFVASLGLTFIGVGMDILFHKNYRPQIQDWQTLKGQTLPHYLEEKSHFSQHPFFGKASSRSKNLATLTRKHWPKGLATSYEEKQTLLGLKEKWLERRFKIAKKPVAPFFENLKEFDFFSQDIGEASHQVFPYDFVAISQIHLAQVVDEPPAIQRLALNQTHQLASILLRSADFNFQMSALSILEKEREFTLFQKKRVPASAELWPFISTSETQRFRRFLYETYDYLDVLVGSALLEKVFLNAPWPTGFCSIYKQKQPHLLEGVTYLKGSLFGEPQFQEELLSVEKIQTQAKNQCPPSSVSTNIDRSLLSRIPFLRRFIGLRYLLRNKSMAKGL